MDMNRRYGESASRERTLQRNKKLSSGNAEIKDFGFIEAMPRINPSHAAAPYNVMGSTLINPTRQNSALQSVVTDQSSTFSARSDPSREVNSIYEFNTLQMFTNWVYLCTVLNFPHECDS